MKVFVVRDKYSILNPLTYKPLNVRQLLNPLFYSRDVRHPDSTRQRCAKQRAKDLAAARRLKAQYVPLCRVDKTVYVRATWNWDDERCFTWRRAEV